MIFVDEFQLVEDFLLFILEALGFPFSHFFQVAS